MKIKLPVIEFIPMMALALIALVCYIIASTVFSGKIIGAPLIAVAAYCWYSLMRLAFYGGNPWSAHIGRRK